MSQNLPAVVERAQTSTSTIWASQRLFHAHGHPIGAPSNKRLLPSQQPSTSRASPAVTTLAAQQNRRGVS